MASPPPGHPRGGRRPPLNLLRGGGEVLASKYSSKIFLNFFLAPCGRRFCNFLQDFRPPLGKSRPPLKVGENFSEGGEKNRARFAHAKTFNLEFSPPLGKFLCTRLILIIPIMLKSIFYCSATVFNSVLWCYKATFS